MAKKSAHAAEPAPAATGETVNTLAEAIRVAYQKLGLDADKDSVVEHIKKNYPHIQYKESTLNSSLSSIRKKLKGETGSSPTAGLTVKELMAVKNLAEQEGGVDRLLADIEKVEGLARRYGGVGRLRSYLTSLKDLNK
jgi:hypothetical protein